MRILRSPYDFYQLEQESIYLKNYSTQIKAGILAVMNER
ncbi:hypothetical protein CRENPOLYSF2_1500019 [Crenothrix polyspora]|uniref:Uncharacterized protein n=1 Tax=Crenothrix polyspora TaxID=360316 RepID=A0A1R4H2V2_9GAMM|nr:hypothetical protein CRENPOLYSF2_1500019 [Crenothrix polyspora]